MKRYGLWFVLNVVCIVLLVVSAGETVETDHYIAVTIMAFLSVVSLRLLHGAWKRDADRTIQTYATLIAERFARSKSGMIGFMVIAVLVYAAIMAPVITPHDPLEINWAAVAMTPGDGYLLGTDDMGRDILTRAIFGLRVVLGVALLSVVVNAFLGTTLGLVAGYYGGWVDSIIMRLLEMWNSVPFILLAIALMAALGTSLLILVLVVSLSGILQFARLIRGSVLVVRKSEFVDAAKVMGVRGSVTMVRHVLPNCVAPIIIMSTLKLGDTILTIAGLSFLGLGIQPPTPSLGAMLSTGQQFLYQNPYMSVVPGILILITVLNFNLLGDGLRDAFDTRLID